MGKQSEGDINYLHQIVQMLNNSSALPPLPLYAFMADYTVKFSFNHTHARKLQYFVM
jgi:hypothetical protein